MQLLWPFLEGRFCEDDSVTRQRIIEPQIGPPSGTLPPPKPEDNIRMPYGDVLKSDAAWSIFK